MRHERSGEHVRVVERSAELSERCKLSLAAPRGGELDSLASTDHEPSTSDAASSLDKQQLDEEHGTTNATTNAPRLVAAL